MHIVAKTFEIYFLAKISSMLIKFSSGHNCDIRPEWTKMQTQQFRDFSSEPSELAVLKE